MHVTAGEALRGGALVGGPASSFSLAARGLQIVLEDDAEELLLVNLDDVTFAARADGAGRDLSLTVLRIQVDNQWDPRSHFPVVVFLDPPGKAALTIAIVERLNRPGVAHHLSHVVGDLGDAYVFIEDKFVARLARFAETLSRRRAGGVRERGSFLPGDESRWEGVSLGIPADLQGFRSLIEPGGIRKDERRLLGSGGDATSGGGEHYVYIESLRLRPCEMHLSLLATGAPDAAQLVRQHAGPLTQRMLAKVRLDDVVVRVPELLKEKQLRTRIGMLRYVWARVGRSLRRSFFSSKMLFKGLDAVSDSWLGVHTTGQRGGKDSMGEKRTLQRIRPLADATDDATPARSGANLSQMTPMARGLNAAYNSMTLENAVALPSTAVRTAVSAPLAVGAGLKVGAKRLGSFLSEPFKAPF